MQLLGTIIPCCSPPSSSVFFSQVTAWSLFGNQRRKVKWLCLPHLIMVEDPVERFQCQRFTLHHTQAHVHRVDPKKGYRYSHGPVKEPVDPQENSLYQCFRNFICWLSTGDRAASVEFGSGLSHSFMQIYQYAQGRCPLFGETVARRIQLISQWIRCGPQVCRCQVYNQKNCNRCFSLVQVLRQLRAQKETKLFQTITKTGEHGTVAWLQLHLQRSHGSSSSSSPSCTSGGGCAVAIIAWINAMGRTGGSKKWGAKK